MPFNKVFIAAYLIFPDTFVYIRLKKIHINCDANYRLGKRVAKISEARFLGLVGFLKKRILMSPLLIIIGRLAL